MSLHYRETEADCKGWGASLAERNNHGSDPSGLSECPQCGADKCCVCDMGDDVECVSCDADADF